MGITSKQYQSIQQAFAFFNRRLFNGELPECLITFQRTRKAYSYFWAGQFRKRKEDTRTDEIALNPDHFKTRTDEQILSTLVHEMCHLWQQHFGKPSRGAYHNSEWAAKMNTVGLLPSDTGSVGGKQTGQSVNHVIVEGGAYQKAFKRLVSQRSWALTWQADTPKMIEGNGEDEGEGAGKDEGSEGEGDKAAKAKRQSKTKYTCACCGTNAWAKPNTALVCGACLTINAIDGRPVVVIMRPADEGAMPNLPDEDLFDVRI